MQSMGRSSLKWFWWSLFRGFGEKYVIFLLESAGGGQMSLVMHAWKKTAKAEAEADGEGTARAA